jgi:Domain of unknown function (DUF4258)
MQSVRFGLPIVLTEHAKQRMAERDISASLVLEIIDTGTLKHAGGSHYWLYKHVVVKTIMHHWEPEP